MEIKRQAFLILILMEASNHFHSLLLSVCECCAEVHSITFQKIVILKFCAIGTSDLRIYIFSFRVGILLYEDDVCSSQMCCFRPGFVVLDLEDVPAGTYNIVPSTFMPNQEGPFILTVKASCPFSLARLQ